MRGSGRSEGQCPKESAGTLAPESAFTHVMKLLD